MGLTFAEAMRRLGAGITNAQVIERFGWKKHEVTQARQRKSHRTKPILPGPEGWEAALLPLARERAADAALLVEELKAAVRAKKAQG